MAGASSAGAAAAALRLVTVPVQRAAAAATATTPPKRPFADAFLFAWRGGGDASTAATPPSLPPLSAAATLGDRAVLLAAHAREAGERRLEREWRAVESSPPRTLKGWLHRLANAVLSRSDPTEAALARVPCSLDAHSPAVAAAIRRASSTAAAPSSTTPADKFEILHPSSVDPRLVRRFLRRLCQKRAPEHRRGALLWALALIPQAPLSVLPLPNVTIYYTLWRAYMHWSASVGAQSLLAALDRLSDEQKRRVLSLAASSPSSSSSSSSGPTPLPAPILVARPDLPSPLAGFADAERLAALLEQPHIVERYAALVRRMERRRSGEEANGGVGAESAARS